MSYIANPIRTLHNNIDLVTQTQLEPVPPTRPLHISASRMLGRIVYLSETQTLPITLIDLLKSLNIRVLCPRAGWLDGRTRFDVTYDCEYFSHCELQRRIAQEIEPGDYARISEIECRNPATVSLALADPTAIRMVTKQLASLRCNVIQSLCSFHVSGTVNPALSHSFTALVSRPPGTKTRHIGQALAPILQASGGDLVVSTHCAEALLDADFGVRPWFRHHVPTNPRQSKRRASSKKTVLARVIRVFPDNQPGMLARCAACIESWGGRVIYRVGGALEESRAIVDVLFQIDRDLFPALQRFIEREYSPSAVQLHQVPCDQPVAILVSCDQHDGMTKEISLELQDKGFVPVAAMPGFTPIVTSNHRHARLRYSFACLGSVPSEFVIDELRRSLREIARCRHGAAVVARDGAQFFMGHQ